MRIGRRMIVDLDEQLERVDSLAQCGEQAIEYGRRTLPSARPANTAWPAAKAKSLSPSSRVMILVRWVALTASRTGRTRVRTASIESYRTRAVRLRTARNGALQQPSPRTLDFDLGWLDDWRGGHAARGSAISPGGKALRPGVLLAARFVTAILLSAVARSAS